MRCDRLEFNDISKVFCDKFLEPFSSEYNPGRVLNAFWQKYTLHEAIANLYIFLRKPLNTNRICHSLRRDMKTL